MHRVRMYIDITYLLLIGATLGAVMILGVVVAPVVFHTETLLSVPLLDNYSEGVVMSEVFRRFGYWCYVVTFYMAVFELYEYKMMRRDKIAALSAIVAAGSMLLFATVYTPKILQMQAQGAEATMSEAFQALHSGSEVAFKVLAAALLLLFYRRVMLLRVR